MQHIRSIVVGVEVRRAPDSAQYDIEPVSRSAAETAAQLAGLLNAQVTLLAAKDETLDGEETASLEPPLGELAAELPIGDVAIRIANGRAWVEIIRNVVEHEQQLVVVGTRRESGGQVDRLLFGSTGLKLLRNCPCPVLLARPDFRMVEADFLVATALDEVGADAVNLGVNAAQMCEARLHVLHAIDARLTSQDEAEQRLNEQLSQTDYRSLSAGVRTHIADGPPAACILDATARYNIDLLVMGTLARGGLRGMLIGNTAESLVSEVKCSLLALKPDDFECPIDLTSA